ncbi:hypothetical protein T10_609 [Trichinella papuae]|uniref:Uncharacterized protein n=1 Tax=Trichinella papuae TaxID=268474 RepID=A0A0V1MRA1_9BILA|nr:hypothetical protein T10_609 [Trichinella papuae]
MFDLAKQHVCDYAPHEHLKFYFQTDDISCEEKNSAILLSICGLATYTLQFHKRQQFYNDSVRNFTASENCNFDSVLHDMFRSRNQRQDIIAKATLRTDIDL